jgi:hypothetical protein
MRKMNLVLIIVILLLIFPVTAENMTVPQIIPSSVQWAVKPTGCAVWTGNENAAIDGSSSTSAIANKTGSCVGLEFTFPAYTVINKVRVYNNQTAQDYYSFQDQPFGGKTWEHYRTFAPGGWTNHSWNGDYGQNLSTGAKVYQNPWDRDFNLGEIMFFGTVGYQAPAGNSVRYINTDIYTNLTINPSNFNISYLADGVSVWYNETGTDGDITLYESAWTEQNIKVCSAAPSYSQMCNNIYIPDVASTIVWQKLLPGASPFPTPSLVPNVTTNVTSRNLTEPMTLPNFTFVDKDDFRDKITNNSVIGSYSVGITTFMDDLGEALNGTVQQTIEFVDVPFDFLIDIQLRAHNLYLAVFLPLIPFTYLPLRVTGAVVGVIPWQIQSLISLGLIIDLFYLLIRGGQ